VRTTVVTGAAGFVGGHLVAALTDRGDRVMAIDRVPVPVDGAVCADLLDGDSRVDQALSDADVVFHLAGCSGVRTDPGVATWRRDNVLATRAVLERLPLGVPLVVTSSSSVYGGATLGRACRESDPLRPLGPYAATKARVEELCRARLDAGGRVTIARPFTIAGEGQRPDMALARWISAAYEGRPIRVIGSTARTRDVADVRDVVRALIALADAAVPGPVNIGTGRAHTLAEMIDAVCEAVARPVAVDVEPAFAGEPDHTLADVSRLADVVGFTPVTDLRALVERQASAYAAGQLEPMLIETIRR
jgi:nucleoside-diphosphate-sugar epimerase